MAFKKWRDKGVSFRSLFFTRHHAALLRPEADSVTAWFVRAQAALV
jgi:hypothetical protein